MRKCEADGCTREVPSTMLMCPQHWRLVPLQLKRAVTATWSIRRTAVGTRAYEIAVAEHEAAKNDAREAVAGHAS